MPRISKSLARLGVLIVLVAAVALSPLTTLAWSQAPVEVDKIAAALPANARVKPAAPRKILVFTLCKGFVHSSIPTGIKALEMMGEKTGAYTVVHSDDPATLSAENLKGFDGLCMLNTTGELFEDAALRTSVVDFVMNGKGLIGIHAATDCFYNWAQYGDMMGGYFDGHPWGSGDTVTLKIDDPGHPVTRAFKGQPFTIMDEIYQFKPEPYSRTKLRVLTSLDVEKTDMTKNGIKRTDGDFAVAWVRGFGKGRVFYCSLGHNEKTYWNPTVLQHYLDGIQFALGDLAADTTPSAQLPADHLEKSRAELEAYLLGK